MVTNSLLFTDIHCHIIPCIDDGAANLSESVLMAKQAFEDGTTSLIATPHQLGTNSRVSVDSIKNKLALLREELQINDVHVEILPGADVRIDPELPKFLKHIC